MLHEDGPIHTPGVDLGANGIIINVRSTSSNVAHMRVGAYTHLPGSRATRLARTAWRISVLSSFGWQAIPLRAVGRMGRQASISTGNQSHIPSNPNPYPKPYHYAFESMLPCRLGSATPRNVLLRSLSSHLIAFGSASLQLRRRHVHPSHNLAHIASSIHPKGTASGEIFALFEANSNDRSRKPPTPCRSGVCAN